MTQHQPTPGVYGPDQCQPKGCAHCGAAICPCPDALYSGTVVIDTASPPGAWARHLRDTDCMRGHGSATGGVRP
jgi:hypothetical protein